VERDNRMWERSGREVGGEGGGGNRLERREESDGKAIRRGMRGRRIAYPFYEEEFIRMGGRVNGGDWKKRKS
jgi:hypothetical protein